jgi:hypothetical protein
MPVRDALLRLRDQLVSLQVDACRLTHEQVIFEKGQAKRRSCGIGVEPAFCRIGLCPDRHRARQLSCAHTTARDVLADVLLALHERGVFSEGEAHAFRSEIQEIADVIHQTDWSKGEAEARYARLREHSAQSATPVLGPEGRSSNFHIKRDTAGQSAPSDCSAVHDAPTKRGQKGSQLLPAIHAPLERPSCTRSFVADL